MHRPQQHNSQQQSVTHFKPIINFGQKRLKAGGGGGGEGSERNVDKKVTVAKSIKSSKSL